MKKINLIINKQALAVPEGDSILQAARYLNIFIPTLCHLDGCETFTSCLVCVVYEEKTRRLLPACSVKVTEGMVIDTENEIVRTARKDTLDLLLSEHTGDCEAPCQRTCPAGMNIPLMIRQIKAGQFSDALITVKKDIALPAVLGRICSAPCEAGCKRKGLDAAVAICQLKRFVADFDLTAAEQYLPPVKPQTGKRIAIIGAGPAGLSAAYYLLQKGHACDIYDSKASAGGGLRKVSTEILPENILDVEIEQVHLLGANFFLQKTLGRDIHLDQLRADYGAVLLTLGEIDSDLFAESGLDLTARGFEVDKSTYMTSLKGVFAGGNALGKSKRAIRACAHGKFMALSVHQMLSGKPHFGNLKRFNSVMGRLQEGEALEFLLPEGDIKRVKPFEDQSGGYSASEAERESSRCFECDCRKLNSCKLRDYCDDLPVEQKRFQIVGRQQFTRIEQHNLIIYEPGKCIKCGLCVRISKKENEPLGLAFTGRGSEVRVEVPFGEPLSQGLLQAAAACVEGCPTGALAFKDRK